MGKVEKEQLMVDSSYCDDMVVIRHPEKPGDPSVITINYPDKTDLGCDLCRIVLFFGVSIVRGDLSTNGRWCYVVFWVVGRGATRWGLLQKRLLGACPSSAQGIYRLQLLPRSGGGGAQAALGLPPQVLVQQLAWPLAQFLMDTFMQPNSDAVNLTCL